jgi:HTH-type transcriptional regulator, sugar sensing transcriptional regulator
MFENVRKILGITEPEFKVYIALMTLGSSSTGKICEETKIASSHIYIYLDSLIQKGLVTWHQTNTIKTFSAITPKNISKLLDDALQKINSEAIEFSKYVDNIESRTDTISPTVRIYQGISGVITAIDKSLTLLNQNETYYVFGSPTIANKKLNDFFMQFHKDRIKKKIGFKIIYDQRSEKYAKERTESPYTEVRLSTFKNNCEITIFKNIMQIIVLSDVPMVIEIENKDVASTFKDYFALVWQFSKKVKS